MAICVFKLKKSQRKALSRTLKFFLLLQIIIGVAIIVVSIVIYLKVAPEIYSEAVELRFTFVVVGTYALNLIILYWFGFTINYKATHSAHKKSTRQLIFYWICATFHVSLHFLIIGLLTRKIYRHIIRAIMHSLTVGMQQYLKDEEWKMTIDRLQYTYKCCGVKSYKEWYDLKWLTGYMDENSEQISRMQSENDGRLPIVPFSCCRLDFSMQCIHDPIQQTRMAYLYAQQPALVGQSLNSKGCIEQVKNALHSYFLISIILIGVSCILQCLHIMLLRVLYTSCRNALLLDDPDGVAPGWLCGRGDFGFYRGRTVLDIMGGAGYLRTRVTTLLRTEDGNIVMANTK